MNNEDILMNIDFYGNTLDKISGAVCLPKNINYKVNDDSREINALFR